MAAERTGSTVAAMTADGSTAADSWSNDVVLADGGTVHVRPLRVDDTPGLEALYDRISAESIYLRFFSPVPRPTAAQLERMTELDAHRRFAFVAELGTEI